MVLFSGYACRLLTGEMKLLLCSEETLDVSDHVYETSELNRAFLSVCPGISSFLNATMDKNRIAFLSVCPRISS